MDIKPPDPCYSHPSEALEFATVPAFINPQCSEFIEPASLASIRRLQTQPSLSLVYPASPTTPSFRRSDELYDGFGRGIPGTRGLANDARAATHTEHQMTVREAMRIYKKAIGWSIVLSLTLVMEGFDKTLMTSFFAFPSFQRDYGTRIEGKDEYQISTTWQASLTNCALVGETIGLLLNGYLTDRFGNPKTMTASLFAHALFIFLSFFAKSLNMLLASQILCGIPLGIYQTLSATYAAEYMPVVLRAYLISSLNLCWVIGQLLATGILRHFIKSSSQWSYRIPFALQWAWILPLAIASLFAPETPWWLVKHEKPHAARRVLARLTSSSSNNSINASKIDESVALMQHTNEVEKHLSTSGGMGYTDCFRGVDLRRTEIACATYMTQSVCGIMTGYAAYFYSQAGLRTDQAFTMSIAMYGAGIMGVGLCWTLMRFTGRRTLYIAGCVIIALILLTAGIIGAFDEKKVTKTHHHHDAPISTTTPTQATVGPICYSLVTEIPSARLRAKTVVLARIAYNFISCLTNSIMPQLLNPTAWNWRGKTCLLWAGAAVLACIWCWFRLPEPKGLTYMELDVLFEKRVGARRFRRVQMGLRRVGYFDIDLNAGEGGGRSWHMGQVGAVK
ncbi:hypothetical protein AJ79_09673 [Helicocarpus griseus UAMH5409]|uniref:Major facilitator superfamily (MFS) profile domain-containing protein n=1 Tax=Helicocarpus griseus UAMH5409 TaxID=1447875 RepID=A0A2B7WIA1_9EURO|nr:hypothetical protein AJ79_09673 [Helicocarpus griseus UAMH5409]